MICYECRQAAKFLEDEKVIYQHLDGRPQELLAGPEVAAKIHATCRGGTWCDCQHQCPVRVPAERPTLGK